MTQPTGHLVSICRRCKAEVRTPVQGDPKALLFHAATGVPIKTLMVTSQPQVLSRFGTHECAGGGFGITEIVGADVEPVRKLVTNGSLHQ